MFLILAFFALPVYDAKVKSLKAYIHIFMNGYSTVYYSKKCVIGDSTCT